MWPPPVTNLVLRWRRLTRIELSKTPPAVATSATQRPNLPFQASYSVPWGDGNWEVSSETNWNKHPLLTCFQLSATRFAG
jgi:hypothetical protein